MLYGGYFFFCAIPHASAARYFFLFFSLLAAGYALFQDRRHLQCSCPIVISTALFLVLALVSALISPYPETLSSFRKAYLTPGLLILVVGTLPWSGQDRHQFLGILTTGFCLGFVVKTMFALWDGAISHPFIFSPYSNPDFIERNGGLPKYVDFFAIDASLYVPFVLGIALFASINKFFRWALFLSVFVAFGIVLVSGIRTAFLVTALAISLLLLYRFAKPRYIYWLVFILSIGVVLSAQLAKSIPEFDRYASLFRIESYSKEAGMSSRYPLWVATYEIADHRPWLGFGPGWKKLPMVSQDLGLLDLWKADHTQYGKLKTYFFTLQPGQTNPHNLMMQLLFEVGRLGSLSFLSLIVSLCFCTWKFYRAQSNNAASSHWLFITTPVVVICYLLTNVTNGIPFPPSLVIILITASVFWSETTIKSPAGSKALSDIPTSEH